MSVTRTLLFVPPRPEIPAEEFGWYWFYKAVRNNALPIWPQAAYTQDILPGSIFGRMRLLVNSPEGIRRVLIDNTANYGRWRAMGRLLQPLMGNGLILSEGEDWRQQRRTIAPTLTPRAIPMLASQVASIVDEVIALLVSTGSRDPVNLLGTVQFVALEVAARSMFSVELKANAGRLRQLMASFATNLARPDFFDLMLPSFPSLRDLERIRWRRKWIALIDEIMAKRLRTHPSETPRDVFDVLRAARDAQTGEALSHEQIRDQVGTMLVTGHETTTLTIFWSLYLLASAPSEQERVAEEVRNLDLSPESAAAAVSQLSFTRAVVNEALRLYPPAFMIARKAIGPDRIENIDVPRGAVVMISPWVLHRHRRLWSNPDAFDPSRFLGAAPPRFAYLPFGVGPRVCVGAHFASTEATVVLAKLIKRFHVELADDTPVNPVAVLLAAPDRLVLFRLRERR